MVVVRAHILRVRVLVVVKMPFGRVRVVKNIILVRGVARLVIIGVLWINLHAQCGLGVHKISHVLKWAQAL